MSRCHQLSGCQAQLVLPVAFLLAIPGRTWSVARAQAAVRAEPNLRLLLTSAMQAAKPATPATPTARVAGDVGGGAAVDWDANQLVVGVDLGGTQVRAAVVACVDGSLLTSVFRLPWATDRSPDAVLQRVCEVVAAAVAAHAADAQLASRPLAGVAVGQPGQVLAGGCIGNLAAFAADWPAGFVLPLTKALVDRFPRWSPADVWLCDDAQAALAAEVAYGAGRLATTVAGVAVGTGVGVAVTLTATSGDRVWPRGARGLVEMGHIVVDPALVLGIEPTGSDVPCCGCGQRGCVEAWASGPAIAHAYAHCGASEIDAREVIRRAAAGQDMVAVAVLRRAAAALALGVQAITRAYDPDVIVFGPQGDGLGAALLPHVRSHLRLLQWHLHNDAVTVPLLCATCPEAGVQGAVALAMQTRRPSAARRVSSDPEYVLRRARVADLSALYAVCLGTGDAGSDGAHLFGVHPTMLGQVYVGPYVTHSPDLAYALCDASGVCGYVLAALDSQSFWAAADRDWWPNLRAAYPLSPATAHGYSAVEMQLVGDVIHGGRGGSRSSPLSPAQLQDYPSHLHIDLLLRAQGHGLGHVLMARILAALQGGGSPGVHLTMAATNARAAKFYQKLGFTVLVRGDAEWTLGRAL